MIFSAAYPNRIKADEPDNLIVFRETLEGGSGEYELGLRTTVYRTCAIEYCRAERVDGDDIGMGTVTTCIHIPESVEGYTVTSVNQYAFQGASAGCFGRLEVWLPQSVKRIEDTALDDDNILFHLPDRLEYLGSNQAGSNREFGAVSIYELPRFLETIERNSMANVDIKSNRLPENLKSILNSGLKNQRWDSVEFPASLHSIGAFAFENCNNLEEVTLPEGLQYLDCAFINCINLRKASVPSTIEQLLGYTFHGCVKLEEVELNPGLVEIGPEDFTECNNLKSLTIPETVKRIAPLAFPHNLRELIFKDGNELLETDYDSYSFDRPITSTLESPIERLYLGRNILCHSSGFDYFENITTLKNVSIGQYVTEITIPFSQSPGIESIELHAIDPPTVHPFNDINIFTEQQYLSIDVTIPKGSLDDYRAHPVWQRFLNIHENESSGISDIHNDDASCDKSYGIYTLSGAKLTNTATLQPGIYIIVEKSKARKILIR